MRLLTATSRGQGERAGDFCHAPEGELVILGDICADDEAGRGDCGCARAFSGVRSHRATTTALVRDVDLTCAELELAIAATFEADGINASAIGDAGYAELFIDTVNELIRFGAAWPEGTVVRRTFDGVTIR